MSNPFEENMAKELMDIKASLKKDEDELRQTKDAFANEIKSLGGDMKETLEKASHETVKPKKKKNNFIKKLFRVCR